MPQRPSEIADAISGLAVVLRDQRQFTPAELLFREALEIERKIFNAEHPHIITTVGSIVRLLQAQGRYRDAEPLLEEIRHALENYRREIGRPRPSIAHRLNDLATMLRGQEKLQESEGLILEAMDIYRQTPP